jgi:endonuclease/exonuclease/phosphatase (EEP) superfamily protein YafD
MVVEMFMNAEPPRNKFQKILSCAPAFAIILAISYGLSLLARFSFFFDLFSHFLLQYAIGGLLLGCALALGGKRKWACLCLAIACAALVESRAYLQEPLRFAPPGGKSALTVVQYNHFLHNNSLEKVRDWLRRNAGSFDVVILQEATPETARIMATLSDVYPFSIGESREDAFGIVILSRHPVLEKEVIPIPGYVMNNTGVRMVIQPPGMKNPVILITVHAIPPVCLSCGRQRNRELAFMAELIRKERHANIIFEGDWNITPYSPWFRDLLKKTGLNYQSYGLFLNPSWPSALPSLFRIPIDQILFSNGLIQTDKFTGPANGSDHLPVIARFSEK